MLEVWLGSWKHFLLIEGKENTKSSRYIMAGISKRANACNDVTLPRGILLLAQAGIGRIASIERGRRTRRQEDMERGKASDHHRYVFAKNPEYILFFSFCQKKMQGMTQ